MIYTNSIPYRPQISPTLAKSGSPAGKLFNSSKIVSSPDGKIIKSTVALFVPTTFHV